MCVIIYVFSWKKCILINVCLSSKYIYQHLFIYLSIKQHYSDIKVKHQTVLLNNKITLYCEERNTLLKRKLCDKVCQWLVTGQWFSPCTPPIKLTDTYNRNIFESGIKHHNFNHIVRERNTSNFFSWPCELFLFKSFKNNFVIFKLFNNTIILSFIILLNNYSVMICL